MATSMEESRQQLLDSAAALVERQGGESSSLLLTRYYRHMLTEDLLTRRSEDLAGAALSHRDLAHRREAGLPQVRVFTPSVEQEGWSTGNTVVEIVTDDMPFLVDSVTSELARHGRATNLLVHPQMVVRRDADGVLVEVLDKDVDAPRDEPGVGAESWMHLEIGRESDVEARERLRQAILKVLHDVRMSVEDWPRMAEKAAEVAAALRDEPPAGIDPHRVEQVRGLLDWMASGQFTFLGYREYRLTEQDGRLAQSPVPGTGLGLLRQDDTENEDLLGRASVLPDGPVAQKAPEKTLEILTKANSRSTVHRPAYLDYVGIKTFDASGEVTGEHRFLGLFTASAYTWSVRTVPYLAEKVEAVMEASGFSPDSHLGKDLLGVLETYPRDELFQADVETLTDTAVGVVHMREQRRTRLFLRKDEYNRFMSCLVYIPRDRYTTPVRLRIESLLKEAFHGAGVEYTTRVSESNLARLHFVVRVEPGQELPDVDVDDLERRLIDATRSWDEDLVESARAEYGEEQGSRLVGRYRQGFPEGYKADFSARVAVSDIRHLEQLTNAGDFRLNLYRPTSAPQGERRLKLYRRGRLTLSTVLPVFADMGLEVTDERPYEVRDAEETWHIYDFGLRAPSETFWTQGPEGMRAAFQDAFEAVWTGLAESDGLNALVLAAGLTWRQVVILRTVAKYLRQAGTTFSQSYIEDTLRSNSHIARLLVEFFAARFDPDHPSGTDTEARQKAQDDVVSAIMEALEDVTSLDMDRIVRSFLDVLRGALRTNFYQQVPAADGTSTFKQTVCLKLDPRSIPGLPEPRPMFEIWVYGPRVEGVHLRFGKVARGGLRWSDRREDFRTEVLGLVKAQMVKNAVIVPTGSKGGFVAKQLPDPSDRDAWLAEGIEAYKLFISSLLDVTDNLVKGEVVPPERVVRHDPDDTYLVVAADKGTAKFSDIANGVAQSYGFWLDDAFASGGSAGYDHKGMGITARGAWESVKRHFRELGHDTQTEDFTAVGIGDMSGDVFGNGMLLSEHIRLVCAFDHRHVFVDPDPDAARSHAERRRLFELPRSSWADYDPELISEGGGVFPRTAKSVPVSLQMREVLGLDEGVTTLTPNELIHAALLAPVDLVWNGGIGTYIKASIESNDQIGDRANDAIRVDGRDLRCRVVGEGGNLGASQLGRIEAALHGVRINTDAIDNSAGVDTSDHEVNIKILLTGLMREDDLTLKQRNELLASMTDDVAAKVLRDNYEQNVLLGNARRQEYQMVGMHQRFMQWLTERGELDRELEFLPSDARIEKRVAEGRGLTSPEFAVLVAYAKLALKADLLESDLPDEPWFQRTLAEYFPEPIQERFGDRLASHPLHREIIVNSVANSIVNRGGITFVYRTIEETNASIEQIARAFVIAREVFGLRSFVRQVEALDNKVSTDTQTTLYLEFRRLMDRAVRWFLQSRPSPLDVGAEIERFRGAVEQIAPRLGELLVGTEKERLERNAQGYVDAGVPEDLATLTASLLDQFSILDIVELAQERGKSPEDIAALYLATSERFDIDVLLSRVARLPHEDRWDALARGAMRDDLYAVLEGLTRVVDESTDPGKSPTERLDEWCAANATALRRSGTALSGITELDDPGVAPLSVGLRTLRSLVRSGSASN
ncbi:NAD-glutamate dehydrogenase [Mobilicoccus pelagius]|uniref:NAD-specific glutamate dehydrogenase n=1 Tax=Mobilicoccus pelagius NBRC 104925 TaxID=1089455 RepID=H5URX7_9MICO|nr:NAD-glutamate dehydrogenase [Mobilicoccus pelagius]GAB48485.1 NAD-specific glutamate dehydrogenase [Mobilicoccus pelagius NBRC 104925]